MNMNRSNWSASISGSPTPSLQSDINVNGNIRVAVPVLDINVAASVKTSMQSSRLSNLPNFRHRQRLKSYNYSATLSMPIARPTPSI